MSTRACEVEGCPEPLWARGMCKYHYQRRRRGQPLTLKPVKPSTKRLPKMRHV